MIRLDWMGGSQTAIIDQHGNRSEDESAKTGALIVPILHNVLALVENWPSPPALLVLQLMGRDPSEPGAAAAQAGSNCCLRFLRPPPAPHQSGAMASWRSP